MLQLCTKHAEFQYLIPAVVCLIAFELASATVSAGDSNKLQVVHMPRSSLQSGRLLSIVTASHADCRACAAHSDVALSASLDMCPFGQPGILPGFSLH